MTDFDASRRGWSLWLIGLVAAVAGSVANLVLMRMTKSSLGVPDTFGPLATIPIIVWSVIGAFGAIGVYALIRRFNANPKRTFFIVAVVVLVLSFIPDVAILDSTEGPFAGATPAAAVVLMVMHVISFAIVVPMVLSLARQPTADPPRD